ncbi:MAG: NADH:flavin oxidoreductase/NADH oxidase [Candidatus Krumholzibacteriia bacterium]
MTRPSGDHLFSPYRTRGITLRNRIVVAPMCQYSAVDGAAGDWHLMHLGKLAAGGAGAVIAEAAAVVPEGRISPADLGLWDDAHVEPLSRVFRFVAAQGAVPGIQLAHAGRKAGTAVPWQGTGPLAPEDGGWSPVRAPSPVPFAVGYPVPAAMSLQDIEALTTAFRHAALRVLAAGACIAEIHAAHGYLLHQFLSPLANRRTDGYGGGFAGRTRLVREVAAAVREVWPEDLPLWVRISATDWVDGGWSGDESVELARQLGSLGVDLIDCSSGGMTPDAVIPAAPGFQVPFAERIRHQTGLATGAVGLITGARQADAVIAAGRADVVLLGRELLRNPHWPLHAAVELGRTASVPPQYLRAF